MNKILTLMSTLLVGVLVAGCGGGGGSEPAPILVAPAEVKVAASPAVTAAVVQTPFAFPSGVAALGTTAATTVAFTSTATTPAFSIASDGYEATGTTTFGSCIFAVTKSNFPVGHHLALGQTVVVNPCNLNVGTSGAVANGVATSRSVALLLGAAASAGAPVNVGVNAGGGLTLNGNSVAIIQLTPVSG